MDHRITSYLPRLLLKWYAEHPHAQAHQYTDHTGVLLFADTSGFTALTRALAKQGKLGFETLTDLLNNLFRSLEQVITLHGGDILKFSGDAVWCYFPLSTPVERVFAEMLYVVDRLNRRHPVCRTHPLSLHAGATAGQFGIVTLGNVESRLEFEIVGSIIPEAYRGADVASAGELALTSPLQNADPAFSRGPVKEGYFVVQPSPISPALDTTRVLSSLSLSSREHDMVAKYVPEAVRERKLNDGLDTGLQSEHRQVAVLFANLLPVDDETTATDSSSLSQAGETVSDIFRIIEDNHGIVARIDPFVRGHKLLALFGALSRSESDRLNALQAAEAILRLPPSQVSVKVGLSVGPLLCGEVGSQLRHEFTVMGEAVNLAARLMSKAEAQTVLLDQALYAHLEELISATERRLSLKGVGDEVTVYQFKEWRRQRNVLPDVNEFFGRDESLEALRQLWQSRSKEQIQWVIIRGEPGMGKTSLVSFFARSQVPDRNAYLSGYGARLHHPGWLLAQWLLRLYTSRYDSVLSAPEFADRLRESVDPRWWPLTDQLLGLTTPDNEWTRGLSSELRLDKLAEIVTGVIEKSTCQGLVILDDLDFADSLSRTILERLLIDPIHAPLTVVLIGDLAGTEAGADWVREITLDGLSPDRIMNWLDSRFVPGVRERELKEMLVNRSEGNPLFINETLTQLSAAGVIGHLSNETLWEVLRPIDEITLADRIEDLQLARFDALPESHRQVLKIASVLDGEFTLSGLLRIADSDKRDSIETILADLSSGGMLILNKANRRYDFAREMTRQAIYSCVPVSDLGRLHRMAGDMLLAQGITDVFRLAFHFSRGDDSERAFEYSLRAGRLAQSKGLLIEAAAGLKRCDQLFRSDSGPDLDREAVLDFLQWAAESATRDGDYAGAQRYAHDWRKLATHLKRPDGCHAAANELARVLWKRSKYNRCRQVLNRLVQIDRTAASKSLLADSYSLLADLWRRTGQLVKAQEAGRTAVSLAYDGRDSVAESFAHNSLGLALWTAGELSGARTHFVRSLELQKDCGSMHAEARVSNNLAIIAEEMGDYIEARHLAEKAKDIFTEVGDRRNQAYASGTLANLMVGAGRYREAIDLYRSADRIFLRMGETHPHYYTVGNLGDLDLFLGDFEAAHVKYSQVHAFALECEDEELEAETTVRLAEHLYYSQHSPDARQLYEGAIGKAEKVGSMEYRIRGTIGLCRYLIGERDAEEASRAIDRLTEFARESKSDRTRYEADFLHGELHRIEENAESALPLYRTCLAYAAHQQQFELSLKSLVRLIELQPDSEASTADQLRKLLEEFERSNGDQMYRQLMSSRYFEFFHNIMKRVVGDAQVGTTP